MHQTLKSIQAELTHLITQVKAHVTSDEPFGIAHVNWSFPALTRSELIEETQAIIDMIQNEGGDTLGAHEARIQDYIRRIQFLYQHTVAQLWSSAANAVPAYLLTLDGLRRALKPVLRKDNLAENAINVRKLANQVRSLEAKLKDLEPRTNSLTTMVERIEQAYDAADQLPTDLESLSEARETMVALVKEATKDQDKLANIIEVASEHDKHLSESVQQAGAVLKSCETAYAASTSVGLAAAFSERSSALSTTMWWWVLGLVLALVAGGYFGATQLFKLSHLIENENVSTPAIYINLLFSLFSVGAPLWFAWLSTKQIGQRFRLAEDYAFKASISRAYEGFRREAARVDKDMEARLLASALARLDELPLRLVEATTHGSPWHELASSESVKQAMKAVPGFAAQVKDLANNAINGFTSPKTNSKPKSKPSAEVDD